MAARRIIPALALAFALANAPGAAWAQTQTFKWHVVMDNCGSIGCNDVEIIPSFVFKDEANCKFAISAYLNTLVKMNDLSVYHYKPTFILNFHCKPTGEK